MDNTSTSQQEISSEVTPAQETSTSTTETTQATQTTSSTDTASQSETWEYNGDRKSVPKEFQKYSAGFDKYVSKKDQAAAEFRKKAEEYDKFVTSESYKSYQQFIAKNPQNAGSSEQPQSTIKQEELDAIMLGDGKTLESIIERKAKEMLDKTVGPKEAEINKRFAAMDLKEKQIQNAEMIQSFAEVNPDFWGLYDSGFEDYIVNSIKSGKSLEETYKAAKVIETKTAERLEANRKADFEKKKAGTVVGKSIPGTPDVVYADDENHAKKLAIELTMKGDKRHVRIKPKK